MLPKECLVKCAHSKHLRSLKPKTRKDFKIAVFTVWEKGSKGPRVLVQVHMKLVAVL